MRALNGLRGLTRERLLDLLEQAERMAEVLERPVPKVPALRGKRIALVFFEPSTRTRMSFDLAARSLGADLMNFTAGSSSLSKGESLLDTAQTIAALGADCLVVRSGNVGMPAFLERHVGLPIVNAGDGTNEHPTQALLDLLTLRRRWSGSFEGRVLAIVGDVARSRVARSHLWAAAALGHRVRIIAPRTFMEPGIEESFGVEWTADLEDGLPGADAVLLLRVQNERRGEGGPYIPEPLDYFLRYGLDRARLARLAPDVPVLHPGPVNRAVEIAPDLIYDPKVSLIQEQVTVGVAVRMAALYHVLGGSDGEAAA